MSRVAGYEGRCGRGDRAHGKVAGKLLGALLALSAAACAGGAHGGRAEPVAKFPTQASLDAIAAQPAQSVPLEPVFRITEWRPTPPEPAVDDPSAEPDRWAALFNETAASHSEVTVAASLGCAAKELARLFAAHGALPDRRLQQFVVGACGGSTPFIGIGMISGDVPDSVPDRQLYDQWKDKLREHLGGRLSHGRMDVGFSFLRQNGKAVAMLVYGEHSLEGVAMPIVADSQGRALIEGTVTRQAQYVQAYINQGALEARECIRDQTVALPRFRVWCQMQPGDAYAWTDLEIAEPNRILARMVGRFLVRSAPDAELQYQAPPAGAVAATPSEMRNRLLSQINGMRSNAGAAPLLLADRQSAVNERLAPHLLAANKSDNTELEDSIMLGLVAGWNVAGMIREGNFYFEALGGTNDVGDVVNALLDEPTARHVLMNRDARHIAIGPVLLGSGGGIGAVLTTYSFFETNDHRADETAVFERIAAARRGKGLPPPHRLDGTSLHVAAEDIQRGTAPDEALRRVARRSARAGYSLLVQTTNLRQMPVPPELLQNGPLNVALGITHYRAPGGAWGQYVVMFLVTQ